ncbi:RNase H family protein [Pirellulaceae bacterium SH449]
MNAVLPYYLLFCDGNIPTAENANSSGLPKSSGRWKFVLEHLESGEKFEACDKEIGASPDRTALIAVLRGLEALEQPSRVTLVTTSRYVFRGLQYGLTEWRANNYSWEHFGSVQPIRNADIWRRIDRTLSFHKVQCRWISHDQQEDAPEREPPPPAVVDHPLEDQHDIEHHEEAQTKEITGQAVAMTNRSETAQKEPQPMVYKDSCASACRVSVTSRVSHTVPTNYGIEEVEKIEASDSEHANQRDGRCIAPPKMVRIDSPRVAPDTNADRTTPKPKFLGRFRTMKNRVWSSIMKLDEEIEGYLRCLLLMEPRPPRREN